MIVFVVVVVVVVVVVFVVGERKKSNTTERRKFTQFCVLLVDLPFFHAPNQLRFETLQLLHFDLLLDAPRLKMKNFQK